MNTLTFVIFIALAIILLVVGMIVKKLVKAVGILFIGLIFAFIIRLMI